MPRRTQPNDPRDRFFPDWVGDIALQHDIARGPQLENLAGLDRGTWFVVAINVELAWGDQDTDHVSIDAVDMTAFDIDSAAGGFTEILALAHQYGALPVTRIELTDTTARTILRYMTRGRIRLQATGIEGDLTVVATKTAGDVGGQRAHHT